MRLSRLRGTASMRTAGPVLAFLLAACTRTASAPPPAQTTPAPSGPPVVIVAHVIRKPLDVTLSMPGQLDPYEAIAVYPKVTGFVRRIPVDRGSHVRAGDLLVELDAPELTAQRAEAQSKVQAADAQLAAARAKADADTSTYEHLRAAAATPGVVAGNDLERAGKTVDADRSQTAAAEQNAQAARDAAKAVAQMQEYLRVTAPFAGVITERNVHPGALVGPGGGQGGAAPLVRLVQSTRLRLVVPVPETYVAGIAEGTMLSFTVPAYPGQAFSGRIARVAHAVDTATRTMAVELEVDNADGRLAPGTYCQVQWPVHRPEPSLLVPSASIATTTDRTFVVRIRNGQAEWVDVKTGLTAGPLIEVFGDLQRGDAIAARGTDEIRPGASVQTRDSAPDGSTGTTGQKSDAPQSLQMGGAKSVTRFFVTSRGVGRGGDLGGIAGADAHCQALANAEGSGDHTWRAYLSASATATQAAVNARDRIGKGPWYNALGDRIAVDLRELHGTNAINEENALTERGDMVGAAMHDILTGSQADGTAFPAGEDLTCGNWTSSTRGRAQVGHSDRKGRERNARSWNSAHPTQGCSAAALEATQGAGLFYCFAIN